MKHITACKNCGSQFEGNFCNQCGQNGNVGKLRTEHFLHDFFYGFFHLKGGLFFTIKELFLDPGNMLRGYLEGKRVGKFNPFTYLIVLSIVGHYLYIHSNILENSRLMLLASKDTLRFTAGHLSYRMLTFVPVYSVINLLLQRSYKYNLVEELTINAYIVSQSALVMLIWLILLNIIEPGGIWFSIIINCAYISGIIYQIYAFVQLYNRETLFARLLKASITAVCGFVFSFFILNVIFYVINLLH